MSGFSEIIEVMSEEIVNNANPLEDLSLKDKKRACEEVEEDEDGDEEEDEDSDEDGDEDSDEDSDEEEEDWSEITIKGVLYYVNPEQTRWIKSDDMYPYHRPYYPGIENDFDYDDLVPIMDD